MEMLDNELQHKIDKAAAEYKINGFAVIDNFLTNDEVQVLKNESIDILDKQLVSNNDEVHLFKDSRTNQSDYFVSSGDKVRAFQEINAFDDNGKLKVQKSESFAKIGHALHALNKTFNAITTSEKIKASFRAIGFEDPILVQSMVIFKNPKVGGEYPPHQDATFLITEPVVALAGAWFALDDATDENGCLEFIPGSQVYPVERYMRKNKDRRTADDPLTILTKEVKYDMSKFVKVPVKRGALILLDGATVHKSNENFSDKPRWIYTFHTFDAAKAKWSEDNWLQEVDNKTFLHLYDNEQYIDEKH